MTSLSDTILTFEYCPGCGHQLGDLGHLVVLATQQGTRALPLCWNCASLMSSATAEHPQLRGLLDAAAVSRHDVWPLRGEWALARVPAAPALGEPAPDHHLAVMAYGCLYLDKSESIEYAETQVAELIAATQRPLPEIALLFDVIGTPAQLVKGAARDLARHLINYVDAEHSGLHSRLVGVTADEHLRPARDGFVLRSLDWTVLDSRRQFIVRR
jgi:hypothetical protein